ncbi:MAG: hypothetical protein Q9169_004522 [Polycauliona sp. 2 TL-2023]
MQYLQIHRRSWNPYGNRFLDQEIWGGCDRDLQNPKDAYSQAIELCERAIAAIGNIEGPKPEDAKEGQEWDRQARLAKALWNLDPDPATGMPSRSMRPRISRILKVYKSVIRLAFQTNPIDDDTKRSEPKDPEEALCMTADKNPVQAFTIVEADMIVFCENELDQPARLGQDVQEGNSKVKAGDALPDVMSSTWLHEMIHAWTKGPREVPDQPLARRNQATGVIERNFKDKTYGFNECANLAKLVLDDAPENADNYATFATVV